MGAAGKPIVRKKDQFTRAKAERLLAHGADPTEERFVKHQNKHVRAKAARLAEARAAHALETGAVL